MGGLLPMHLYISQAVGNEPLAALFASCALAVAFRMLQNRNDAGRRRDWVLLGLLVGLGLLTKVTVLLLLPPLV